MSVIINISTTLPKYKHAQKTIAGFMSNMLNHTEKEKGRLSHLYAKSGINHRYSILPDFSCVPAKRTFFSKTSNLEPVASVEQRMNLFNTEALPLAIKAIKKTVDPFILAKEITHLITISCTGLCAPGMDVQIVKKLKLDPNVQRTSVNFMGCYATMHALKQADYICKTNAEAKVLIVSVELCTIHFQKINDADNIVANMIFGDGAAAALIVSDNYFKRNKLTGLRIQSFKSQIVLEGESTMAWQVSSRGFLMTLSSYVPKLIESGIRAFYSGATNNNKIKIKHWAIHPGGKKILEVIGKELNVKKDQMKASYDVLEKQGNMSSATILFVLQKMLKSKFIKRNDHLFAVAFGPGLTMESSILKYV